MNGCSLVVTTRTRITEADWLLPLVLVRDLAERHGLLLTDAEEQQLVHDMVEALTAGLIKELTDMAKAQNRAAGTA